jgi:AcrR family transcriptional regulator
MPRSRNSATQTLSLDTRPDEVHSLVGIQSESTQTRWQNEGAKPEKRIIEAAYRTFYRDGFKRAGVDAIAEAAHVTKRTLYYHFDSKDSLLAAVLDNQNDLALGRIRRWAEKACGEPAEIVAILFAEIEAWAKQPGWSGTGFTSVAMELADMPEHPARLAASRHKAAVEQWLTAQFAAKHVHKPAVLARQVILLIEGPQSLALSTAM